MDEDELARRFDQHGKRLFGILLAMLGRVEDAEDALQTLFVKLAGVRAVECEKAYLDRMARNEAISAIRRRRRPPPRPPERLEPRPGATLDEAEAIEAALAKVPAEQAEVIVLKTWN